MIFMDFQVSDFKQNSSKMITGKDTKIFLKYAFQLQSYVMFNGKTLYAFQFFFFYTELNLSCTRL